MSADIQTVHSLMLDASSNDAEEVLNILRNSGLAVRATQVVNEEELSDALERQSWDIFIAKNNCPQLPVEKAVALIKESGRDIPCVQLAEEFSAELLFSALQNGINLFIPDDNSELLEHTVHDQLNHLEDRRRRKRAEAQLSETEKRCELLLANSRDAIAYIHEGMHIYANRSYLELFGFVGWDELEAMPIMDMISKTNHESFKEFLKLQSTTPDETPFDFIGVESTGEEFEGSLSLSSASYDGESCIQVLIANRNVDNEELQEKLRELTHIDTLTGLANRESLLTRLTETIHSAANNQLTASIAYIELDQFDEWEEKFGLRAADEIRTGVANWLKECSDDHDLVARVGDHTFAVLRTEVKAKDFLNHCKKLLSLFSEALLEVNKQTVSGTLSIGICKITESSPDAQQVIYDAHAAANRAIAAGGNSIRKYEGSVDGANTNQQQKEILRLIQEAMETGRAHLMFQPIVKLHGESQQLFQVLLRVRDEKDEPVPVTKLFPITQGTKLALKLDYWIIAQSLRALKEHRASTEQTTKFFVQLSPTALEDENLCKYILKTTKTAGLPHDSVIYQVDENEANTHLKQVKTLAQKLSDNNIKMAINRFGAGLASENILNHLDESAVPYVRIAGEVIQEELVEKGDTTKLQSLIKLAKEKNRITIVPMIEEAQTLAQIWPMGIDYVQGYYLSPPSPNLYFDFSEARL
jgi:diguanylate cyclase (GGDEF)-like protein/PAS domain S-box-containing protein